VTYETTVDHRDQDNPPRKNRLNAWHDDLLDKRNTALKDTA
jgi:hypothetical protein